MQIDTPLTFFLFKVVIGRAFCYKGKTPPESCPEGYDSVYMEPEFPNSIENVFSHKYAIYNYERVQLIHQVVAKVKVEPLS